MSALSWSASRSVGGIPYSRELSDEQKVCASEPRAPRTELQWLSEGSQRWVSCARSVPARVAREEENGVGAV